MLRSPGLHLPPVENLFLVRSRGHDGFGVRDTLEHHGLACTLKPSGARRARFLRPMLFLAQAAQSARRGLKFCPEEPKSRSKVVGRHFRLMRLVTVSHWLSGIASTRIRTGDLLITNRLAFSVRKKLSLPFQPPRRRLFGQSKRMVLHRAFRGLLAQREGVGRCIGID